MRLRCLASVIPVFLAGCATIEKGPAPASAFTPVPAAISMNANDAALRLDQNDYTNLTVTVDGSPMKVRRYEAVYVARPVAMAEEQVTGIQAGGPGDHGDPGIPAGDTTAGQETAHNPYEMQSLIIYVPENADTDSAIILHVNNAGWFASPVKELLADGEALVSDSNEDRFGKGLAEGYVLVSLGTRSRRAIGADGSYAGKAPAVVVDAKAAVRYLRLNDDLLPGSAEQIVITGTSGGGGLSTIVAASGNSDDFFPYLAEIGAAGIGADGNSTIRDDVFATIAYCPITDLGHADLAYEWLYGAIRTDGNTRGGLSEAALASSKTLTANYPAYLESLGLTYEGAPMGAVQMRAAIKAQVVAEVEKHLALGGEVPTLGETFSVSNRGQTSDVENTWLTVGNGRIEVDFEAYLEFVTRTSQLKTSPAFDTTANSGHEGVQGEDTLFGPASLEYMNFTPYGWDHNEVAGDGSGSDDTGEDFAAYTAGEGAELARQIALIDPFTYLSSEADAAPYWYVRHGMIDRDTAFAVPVALTYAAKADESIRDVNFALAWMRPHSGNYDVQEAYHWLAQKLAEAQPGQE